MRTTRDDRSSRPDPELSYLQTLGIDEDEGRALLSLVAGPTTATALAKGLGFSKGRASTLLGSLVEKGLVHRLPGKVVRFAMSPPDWVLPALLRNREDELEQARRFAHELSHRYRAVAGQQDNLAEEYVEVIVGVDAVLSKLDEEVLTARSEVLAFSKNPMLGEGNPAEEVSLSGGVMHRALYDHDHLETPGVMRLALAWAEAGEEIRVVPALPAKLVIVDRKTAIVNVTETSAEGTLVAGMITRHPELVSTLLTLFEVLWKDGLPLASHISGMGQPVDEEAGHRDELIRCLAAGMTDAATSRHLGIAARTLSRRIQNLLDDLECSTRFQAGFKAGLVHAGVLKSLNQ